MYLTSFLQNGQLTIVLTGEIDHHSAKQYIDGIAGKLEAYRPSFCILDFADVTFMDSSGIAVAINTMRSMKKMNGTLLLTGLNAQPLKVFKASGVDRLIQIKGVNQ